jgi:hypothetical protein
VIGLPNNLTPFVEAGIMAGVSGTDRETAARALDNILYDEEFRRGLRAAQEDFLARHRIRADGHAAARAAEAIIALTARRPTTDD